MRLGALKIFPKERCEPRKGDDAMDFLIRIVVGVGAAWIVPDPAPQQSHPSGYEQRCSDDRCVTPR